MWWNKGQARQAERRFAIASNRNFLPYSDLSTKGKAKSRAGVDDDAGSVDSMAMEVDEPDSEFGSDTGRPPSGKKGGTSRGKKAAPSTTTRKKASSSGRKAVVSRASHSACEA